MMCVTCMSGYEMPVVTPPQFGCDEGRARARRDPPLYALGLLCRTGGGAGRLPPLAGCMVLALGAQNVILLREW